jgi:hypothetical protein
MVLSYSQVLSYSEDVGTTSVIRAPTYLPCWKV